VSSDVRIEIGDNLRDVLMEILDRCHTRIDRLDYVEFLKALNLDLSTIESEDLRKRLAKLRSLDV
jgi:hypothetical protein